MGSIHLSCNHSATSIFSAVLEDDFVRSFTGLLSIIGTSIGSSTSAALGVIGASGMVVAAHSAAIKLASLTFVLSVAARLAQARRTSCCPDRADLY